MRFQKDDIRRRLDQALETAVAVMDRPAAMRDNSAFADEVDGSQVCESHEIDFATRELLGDRVKRLEAALDRLDAGEYGTCLECAAAIPVPRLRAAPEAQTCIRCQDALERRAR